MPAKFEAIVPKNPLSARRLADELNKAIDASEKEILKEFEKTTKTWDGKVKFETFNKGIFPQKFTQDIALEIGTTNQIYKYVSEGTKPHAIYPKQAKALRFQSGYKSKTVSGRIPSRQGGVIRGSDVVYARQVQHPGTKAREFEQRIEKKMGPKFRRRIKDAIKRAVRGK